MPVPILPILYGIGAAAAAVGGTHHTVTSIKDRNKAKKLQAEYEKNLRKEAAKSKAESILKGKVNPVDNKQGTNNIVPAIGPVGNQQSQQQAPQQGGNFQPYQNPKGVGLYSTQSPQQQQVNNAILQHILPQIGKLGGDFGNIEKAATEHFTNKVIPSISARYAELNNGNGDSFGFKRHVGEAAKDLERDLSLQRENYEMRDRGHLENLLKIGLQPQYEAFYKPKDALAADQTFGNQFLNSLLQAGINPENIQALGGLGKEGASQLMQYLKSGGQIPQQQGMPQQQGKQGGFMNNLDAFGKVNPNNAPYNASTARMNYAQNPMQANLSPNFLDYYMSPENNFNPSNVSPDQAAKMLYGSISGVNV